MGSVGTPSPRAANRRRPRAAGDPRSRIAAAMLQLVSKQGYEPSTVAEVIALIGMSRKTFYEQFEDRRSCFLWVCEQVAARWHERAEQALEQAGDRAKRAEALIEVLFEQAIEQPGALRAAMLEAAVVRPGGLELRSRVIADWSGMLAEALRSEPGNEALSPELSAAIFGGIVRVLHARLPAGVKPRAPRRRALMELVPQLAAWADCYAKHPPAPRRAAQHPDGAPRPLLFGGRAPGTLALTSRANGRRGLPRGENPISRSFVVHSQRERILDAVANLAAAEGYAELTIPEIVQEAAVSVQAFYEHFSGKEDAFLVAYEVGHRRALVAFERAFESQEDWPNAVQAALQALLGFFASEPSFAHCAVVEALSASRRTAVLLEQGIAGYMPMLERGYAEAPAGQSPPPIAAEAIASAIHELCFAHVVAGKTRELADLAPEATFLALAPFLGGGAAAQIAGMSVEEAPNGNTGRGRARARGQS